MTAKLIVALDFATEQDALNVVDRLDPKSCALKIGSELFTLLGSSFVKQLLARNFKIFLDLKYHDIPNTVAQSCKAAADLGIWMMNVHASGGMRMMHAAKTAIESYGADRPLLVAVTVLTSFNQEELAAIGINKPLIEQVKKLAILAREAGLDGVVSSAYEVPFIKNECGSQFITVTPGIRLAGNENNDQLRVMTAPQAIAAGSDYLVVGRPITQSSHPEMVVAEILSSMSV